jgi:hypothetical protein
MRDDSWGDHSQFADLSDGGKPGKVVTRDFPIPNLDMKLGSQRVGLPQLALAVDPSSPDTVFIAYGAGHGEQDYALHLIRSTDGGQSFGLTATPYDIRTIVLATNPAIAVNSDHIVAFLYQKFHPDAAQGNRWETHVEVSKYPRFYLQSSRYDNLLSNVPDQSAATYRNNTIGDYASMIAIGKNFYGSFSAYNYPDKANFPLGVVYLRDCDFVAHTLTGARNSSTDPFFFRVTWARL